jgi:hypothetical protein
MKITIESTTKLVTLKPIMGSAGVECRVWEGATEAGIRVVAWIPRIAVADGQDVTQFEAELKEMRAPSAEAEAIPLRMIL